MIPNGWWIWSGNPKGASVNDISLAKSEVKELQNLMEPRDMMICDRAFSCIA